MPKTWSQGGLSEAQIARIESQFRVPVDTLFGPVRQAWIIALARESLLPDDRALRILRDASEWQIEQTFQVDYAHKMLTLPLAAEGTWNTQTFYLDEDGWHGRRATWREGFPYWPAIGMEGRAPGGSLVEVLEHFLIGALDRTDRLLSPAWKTHLRLHADLYGPQK